VANLIGGDHFHSQLRIMDVMSVVASELRWDGSGGQKSRYKAEKDYRSITQRDWLSQQVEMIEIVGSKAYGTH
jgi:hypothetical protein